VIPEEIVARWRGGELVPGVAFPVGAHVRILDGPFADDCGRVRELLQLEPESCYRVEVDAAHVQLELGESSLANP